MPHAHGNEWTSRIRIRYIFARQFSANTYWDNTNFTETENATKPTKISANSHKTRIRHEFERANDVRISAQILEFVNPSRIRTSEKMEHEPVTKIEFEIRHEFEPTRKSTANSRSIHRRTGIRHEFERTSAQKKKPCMARRHVQGLARTALVAPPLHDRRISRRRGAPPRTRGSSPAG